MDIFQLLKKDHKKVTAIFDKIEDTGNRAVKTREKLFEQLKEELEVHTEVEERVFYPALEASDETKSLIEEAREDHEKSKQLLHQLASSAKDDTDWMNKLSELKKEVKHHIKEEEGEIFPSAKQVLNREQIEQLGIQAEDEKEEILAFQEK